MSTRRLIIMRHATAAGAGGGSDHERPLTAIGRAEAERVGARLLELSAAPDRALSSSAVRCRETFDALAIALAHEPLVHFEKSLYNAGPAQLRHALAADPLPEAGSSETVLLLAHNPGVSLFALEIASTRAAEESGLRAGFAPASFALFEVDSHATEPTRRSVRLLHFERPDDPA